MDRHGFHGRVRLDTARFGEVGLGMGFTIWSGEAGCCAAR